PIVLVLLGALSAWSSPGQAQGTSTEPTSEALETAASCLQRFSDGEELPEVRRRAAEPQQASLLALLGGRTNPEAADARARLAQCMPRAARVPSRLTRSHARWLAGCFLDASVQLGAANNDPARAAARQRSEGCREVARAMATWDPDISAMTSRRRAIAPGIRFDTIRELGQSATLRALEETGPAVAACRTAHGEGTVRVVARYSGGAWQIETWLITGAPGLRECTQAALRRAPALAQGARDETEALDLLLTSR
ncbi:MAG: hypothetical protein AB8H86_14115, partial [Polyangiales bacterium]